MDRRPKKLMALADVHIFNHKRFDEHTHVFKNLYRLIERERPELIVLVGDIIDSKLRLGPEQISLCRDFLLSLSGYAPIIMIPGNHDAQLNNKGRMDSLSPIVGSLKGNTVNEIEYITSSGIYNRFGMDWAIWSCLEDQSCPFPDTYVKERYTVGLYHGVVSGAMTDDGFALSGGIELSEFDRCDLVLCGDIHKVQSFRNGEIGYTGSLIQVNVSEEPHGSCIVCDRSGDGYEMRIERIRNDYSTVNFELGSEVPAVLPTQKIRMRFDTETVTKSQAMEAAKRLRLEHDVRVDVVPYVKRRDRSIVMKEDESEVHVANINDYFVEFIEKARERLDIKDFDGDVKTLSEYEKEFSKGEVKEFEAGDYAAYKLVINNVLSFGPYDTHVDLEKDGLVGIVGKNRSGKTNICKSLQFVLFNEIPNNSSAIKLINKYNRNKPGYVEVYLRKANRNYKIRRTLTPNKKGTGVDVALQFFEIDEDGNDLIDLTKESRPYTDAEIRRYLGINETFEMLSVFSAQKRQTEFIDCKNAQRLQLVNKFLGLQGFEMREEGVMNVLKEKNAAYNALMKNSDNSTDIEVLLNELNKTEVLLKLVLNEEEEMEKELDELSETYGDIVTVYNVNLRNSSKKIEEPVVLMRRIDDLESERVENLTTIEKNVEKSKEIYGRFVSAKEQFEYKHTVSYSLWKPDYKQVDDMKGKLAVIHHELAKARKQLSMEVCASCGKEFSDTERDVVSGTIRLFEEQKKEINDEIVSRETLINEVKDEVRDIKDTLSSHDVLISRDNVRFESCNRDISVEVEKIRREISEYDGVQDALKTVNLLRPKVEEYNSDKRKLSDRMSEGKYKIGNYRSRIKELSKRIEETRKRKDVLLSMEDEIRLLKAYRKIVSKDGLPLYILQSKIGKINERVNIVVGQVFDFKLEFSIDQEKGELKIQFAYDDETEPNDIGLASGSENFVINICIKVGLSQISTLPRIDSFFIDEGYDSLDESTIERLPALFGMLTGYYKNVITISHMDVIKDMCNHQIMVQRQNRYSYIS